MSAGEALLLAHTAATLAMVGIIWFVQVVHYPLFDGVGTAFAEYEARHTAAVSRVIAVPAVAEVVTAGLLVPFRPDGVPAWMPWSAGALLASIWLLTLLVQVPLHRRLGAGFDAGLHGRLVATNWLRTAAWTARGALALAMTAAALGMA
jgi:hypothetical protein